MSFVLLPNTKYHILKYACNQTVSSPPRLALYFISRLWKSMAAVNSVVTSILLNMIFCVQQKKETHTGLDQHEGE